MKTKIELNLINTVFLILLFTTNLYAQIKVHDDGQISLQSLSKTDGVQVDVAGRASFEPNLTANYARLVQTKARTNYVKAWIVNNVTGLMNYDGDIFYVMGNGDLYSGNHYIINHEQGARNGIPIEGASSILSEMTGYYLESHEYDNIDPDFEDNPNVSPEAVGGLMQNLKINRNVGLSAEELENVFPEAIRHDAEGKTGINYNAIVTVLVEAFKEQQTRIDRLEFLLRENGLKEQ